MCFSKMARWIVAAGWALATLCGGWYPGYEKPGSLAGLLGSFLTESTYMFRSSWGCSAEKLSESASLWVTVIVGKGRTGFSRGVGVGPAQSLPSRPSSSGASPAGQPLVSATL